MPVFSATRASEANPRRMRSIDCWNVSFFTS